jgi:hypothetical protein
MLILLATAVPTNIGGWGPREGVAAWAFGAAGLGAAQGVATGTVYGLLSLAAISPAVPLLVAAWLRRRRSPSEVPSNESPTSRPDLVPAAGRSEGGVLA